MITRWLICNDVLDAMRRGIKNGTAPTPAQCAEWEARFRADGEDDGGASRVMTVVDGVAEIRVCGALTKRPSYYGYYYGDGNTAYQHIQAALAQAQANPSIKRVIMRFDSPGGSVDGFFETVAAIEAFTKPISSVATRALSAAFGLASACGKLEAELPSASFGSVGVAVDYLVWPEEVSIASTEAPNKRPDLTTEEGKAIVRKELDDLHALFVESIARGRTRTTGESVSAETVNKTYGRGGVLLAAEAKRAGMIDRIAKVAVRSTNINASAEEGAAQETDEMDLKTLKAQHPDHVAAIKAEAQAEVDKKVADAAAAAVAAERDRVGAHLVAGEMSGDMKTAHEAIKSGEPMTQTLQAKYMAAGMNRSARASTQADSDAADNVVAGSKPKDDAEASAEPDLGDKIVALRKKHKVAV